MNSPRLSLAVSLLLPVALILGCAEKSSTQPAPAPPQDGAAASTPDPEGSTASAAMRSGTFVTGEHPTSGTVRIRQADGQRSLELQDDFQTSSLGPDLVVALHRSEDVIGGTEPPAYAIEERDIVVLAPLREFTGAQSYEIPESVVLEGYKSAIIWCRRFNATFGAARLQ